jgi:hypothetical protein
VARSVDVDVRSVERIAGLPIWFVKDSAVQTFFKKISNKNDSIIIII